jgi:hypothetical protein
MERRRRGIGRHFPGIGGEFRMLFPSQHGGSERCAVMFFRGRWRLQATRRAQRQQVGAVGRRPRSGGIEREMHDA